MTKTIFAIFFCLAGLAVARGSDLDFILVNQTPRSFEAVYVSAANDDDWDGNLLKDGKVLEPEGRLTVVFDETPKTAIWDLNIIDSDGLAVRFDDLNLIDAATVTLKVFKGKITAEIE